MSYEHCDVDDEPATNGCPVCEREDREQPFKGNPRPWRVSTVSPRVVVSAAGLYICQAPEASTAELIVARINEGFRP